MVTFDTVKMSPYLLFSPQNEPFLNNTRGLVLRFTPSTQLFWLLEVSRQHKVTRKLCRLAQSDHGNQGPAEAFYQSLAQLMLAELVKTGWQSFIFQLDFYHQATSLEFRSKEVRWRQRKEWGQRAVGMLGWGEKCWEGLGGMIRDKWNWRSFPDQEDILKAKEHRRRPHPNPHCGKGWVSSFEEKSTRWNNWQTSCAVLENGSEGSFPPPVLGSVHKGSSCPFRLL